MRPATLLASLCLALSLAGAAVAQGFPVLSFAQMITLDERLIQEQRKPERPGDLFFNPGENGGGRVNAVYSGQSRPLDLRRQAFITAFAATSAGNEQYASLYLKEYRFTAGGKDWWLPVQNPVAAYFAKELKAGETVTLYVRNAGGFRLSDSWDWVFLVEEFDTPGGADKTAPPEGKGQPGARKPIPKGPKVET
ncbi:MAG: hypothetical protein WDN45_11000 [Caulobacteraceae bacterium]